MVNLYMFNRHHYGCESAHRDTFSGAANLDQQPKNAWNSIMFSFEIKNSIPNNYVDEKSIEMFDNVTSIFQF